MNLHLYKEQFYDFIALTADYFQIDESIVEKDYYVTLFLKNLFTREQGFVFKGGTSLSKCFHVINRFSEDIDINYIDHANLTQGKRKQIKQIVKDIAEENGFTITNLEKTRSKRDFNQYRVSYDANFMNEALKKEVIIEMAFQIPSFPVEKKKASSLICEYISKIGQEELLEKYKLQPFEVTVQSLQRTFIDKLFAIADYSIQNNLDTHSRHLYDLHKIYPLIEIDEQFFELLKIVKEKRACNKMCFSAHPNVRLKEELEKIVKSEKYKNDFEIITRKMCYENTTYYEVIESLKRIINDLKKYI